MILPVDNCARCGLSHPGVSFISLKRPIVVGMVHEFEYWGICPTTNEPILMQIELEQPRSGPVHAKNQES